MDTKQESLMALNQYESLLSILRQKGLSTESPSVEEFEKLPLADQTRWVKSLASLARTPTD